MNSLIVSLTLAAVSAITFVAYKHPKGYSNIYSIVKSFLQGVGVATLTFFFGYITSAMDSLRINAEKNGEDKISSIASKLVYTADMVDYAFWVICAVALLLGYLLFLKHLPSILELDNKKDTE